MEEYRKYINRLKEYHKDVDYALMYAQIEDKMLRRPSTAAPRLSAAIAGTLILLFIGFFAYFNYFSQPFYISNGLMSYIFEGTETYGNPVMDYVFSD